MRCHGLDIERKRCADRAIEDSLYCESHRVISEIDDSPPGCNGRQPRRLFPFRFRSGSERNTIPDPGNYDLPHYFKSSSVPVLIDTLLHDPNASNRWSATYALRKRRDPAAIDPLWQVLQKEPVSLVRQQAAVAIGKIGTSAAISPLVEGLWHDPDAGVRQACAIALGNLRDSKSASDLARALERERAAFVRWDCVLALGQVGDRSIEPVLRKMIDREKSQVVRQAYREVIEGLQVR